MVDTIYLVRHAQSIGNKERDYGVPNATRLSETGRRQADQLKDALADLEIDTIACSPLERTRDTILPYLEEQDRRADIWPELREACWQDHEIEPVDELRYGPDIVLDDEYREYFSLEPHEYPACRIPDDETYSEGLERIKLTRSRIAALSESGECESLLLVGHGNYFPRLVETFLDITPYGRFSWHNVGVTKLERDHAFEPPFRVVYANRNPLATDL